MLHPSVWAHASLLVAVAACGSGPSGFREAMPASGTDAVVEIDDHIEARLMALIERDPLLRGRVIEFEAHAGVVAITGRVGSDEEKRRVGELARRVPGVRELINALIVPSPSGDSTVPTEEESTGGRR